MCGKTLIDPFFLLALAREVASVACLMGPTTSKKSFLLNSGAAAVVGHNTSRYGLGQK